MKLTTKTKPALHLKQNEVVVLTNKTSGKQSTFKVYKTNFQEENYVLPVRVILATPEPRDPRATQEMAFGYDENVEILAL